jgi:hypothetical protein
MTKTVLYNQSILDISIQYTGRVDNCFAIAIANGLSVSDVLSTGFSLDIPEALRKDSDVYIHYEAEKIKPATGVTDPLMIPTLKGIGYMKIGGDFKVS